MKKALSLALAVLMVAAAFATFSVSTSAEEPGTLAVRPHFGQIENWSGKTFFITGIHVLDAEGKENGDLDKALLNDLKNGSKHLSVAITDATTKKTYFINGYQFDNATKEFYSSSPYFVRMAVCDYGVPIDKTHKYGVTAYIFEGQKLIYKGSSAADAFGADSNVTANGPIVPAKAPHTCEVMDAIPANPKSPVAQLDYKVLKMKPFIYGANIKGFENWASSKQTELLLQIPKATGNLNTAELSWQLTVNDGKSLKILHLPVASVGTIGEDYIYRFEPCLGTFGNQFIPVKGTTYKIKAEIFKDGKLFAKSDEVDGFQCTEDPIMPWTYTLTDGVLKVEGLGYIGGSAATDYPWDAKRSEITKIVISDGIVGAGAQAFTRCGNLTAVETGRSFYAIGNDGFSYATKLETVVFGAPIEQMGQGVFYNSKAITNVTLTNQTKAEFTKVATVKQYNMKANGGIATGLDTAAYKEVEYIPEITINAYPSGESAGWENSKGDNAQTLLLIRVMKTTPRYDFSTEDYTWKVTFTEGGKSKTVELKCLSKNYWSGSGNTLYRFTPCDAEGENQFVPVAGKTYSVKVEIFKKGETRAVAASAVTDGFKVAADFAPIVPTPPTPPTPPVTGDATVYVAVLAVVALFGTAVVVTKKVLA